MRSVSVIVPVHNVSAYLRAGLDALRGQSLADWTAVCVDDGSTDGSGAILDEYAAKDVRIRVVHQANAGVSAARNVGLDLAEGEVVAFLDPDDTVGPDWLARMAEGLERCEMVLAGYSENGRTVVSRDVGTVYADDGVRRRCWRAFFGYRLRDVFKLLLPGGLWGRCGREMAGVWRCAARRDTIGDLRFDPRLRLYEDAMFISQLSQRAKRLGILGDCGYAWQVRPRGAMTRERAERLLANKFAVRDARRKIDPTMTHWRGTFVLSAAEILRETKSLRTAWRYWTGKGNEP